MTANENQIVVYQPNETVRLDVRLENETVWLSQSQMATLFGCSSDNIGLHLKNVYAAGELVRESTTEDFSVVRMEGSRQVRRNFFVQTKEPPLQSIFYQNKFWDAKSLLIKFIRRAKKELIVIDAYPDVATLDMLSKRGRGVKIELVTHSNGELEESDFEAFGAQCGKFTKTICGICHDRFIIVDQKEIFWTGASLKDAGRLTFAAAKMGAEVIPGLLESIRKAMPKTRDCLRCHIGTLNGRREECVITNCDKFERLSFKRVSDVKEAA